MPNVCVLIVDDNEDNLDLLYDMLDAEGYTVYRATNGPQAVQLANARTPDVIVLDLMMPHMDGLAVYELLKSNPRTEHIPCILNTAYSDRKNLADALRVGFTHVLCKPLNRVRLIHEINECLVEASSIEARNRTGSRQSAPPQGGKGLNPSIHSFDHVANIDRAIGPTTSLGKRLIEAANEKTQPGSLPVKSVPGAIVRLGVKACRQIIEDHARETGSDAGNLEALVGAISPLVNELHDATDPETALLEKLRQIEDGFVSSSQLTS